jgi:hypothetical protein
MRLQTILIQSTTAEGSVQCASMTIASLIDAAVQQG